MSIGRKSKKGGRNDRNFRKYGIPAALFLVGMIVLSLFLWKSSPKRNPDLRILWAIDRVSEETVTALERSLSFLCEDVNGDGQVVVSIRTAPSFAESVYSPTYVLLSDRSFDLLFLSKYDMLTFFLDKDYPDVSRPIANSAFTKEYDAASYYTGQILWEDPTEEENKRAVNAARIAELLAGDDTVPTEAPPKEITYTSDGRILLTLGFSGERCVYESAIRAFNANQNTYSLSAVNYQASSDSLGEEECREQLLSDLKAGTGPDLIDLDSFGLCVDNEQFSLFLTDLYPFLDADRELSSDDILPSFRALYEVDGKWLSTATSVLLNALIVSESAAGADGVWTLEDLPGTVLSDKGIDLFSGLISLYSPEFIDYESAAADLDNPDFVSLLSYAVGITSDGDRRLEKPSLTDDLYLVTLRSFFFPELFEAVFPDGYVYARRADGSFAAEFNVGGCLAMTSNALFPEACWEFLRPFFTADYQVTTDGFPTNITALKILASEAECGNTTPCYEYCFPGGEMFSIIRSRAPDSSLYSKSIAYGAAGHQQTDEIWALLDQVDSIWSDRSEYVNTTLISIAYGYAAGEYDPPELAAFEAQRRAERALILLQ